MRLTRPPELRRVLLLTDCVGGVWQYGITLARGLAARGVEVVMAVPGPPPGDDQREQALRIPGLRLIEQPLPLEWQVSSAAGLQPLRSWVRELARRHHVDLVHLNGGMLADLMLGVPVVVTQHSCLVTWWQACRPHEPLPLEWRWYADRLPRALAAAEAVIAPSQAFARALAHAHGLSREPHVVRNGHDRRRALPSQHGRASILTAGRLWDEAKNIKTLDRAAEALPWPVVAAGPLEAPDGTRQNFKHLQTPGALPAVALARRLREAAMFTSPALYEPFGLAVVEAASAGCALVLADIPSFRELWGDAALFVDTHDPHDIAATLERLIADEALRRELAARGRSRSRRYGAARFVTETLAVYREALAGHQRLPLAG